MVKDTRVTKNIVAEAADAYLQRSLHKQIIRILLSPPLTRDSKFVRVKQDNDPVPSPAKS